MQQQFTYPKTACPFRFIPMDQEARGLHRAAFFSKKLPAGSIITVADPVFVSSHFSYAFLNSGELTVGVLFLTPTLNTSMDGSRLVVSMGDSPCKKYVPNYSLESFGLLMSIGDGGTVLIIPRNVTSPLLVEVT